MYRFLVDEDSPKGLVQLLNSKGYDAIHIVTAGLSGTKDPELALWAKEQNRIIVTRDLGFGNLLTYPLGSLPGVILIRVPEEFLAREIITLATRLLPILKKGDVHLTGALVVVEPNQIRIREPQQE